MKFNPSNKVVYTFIFVLLIIVSTISINAYQEKIVITPKQEKTPQKKFQVDIQNQTTEKGFFDWQQNMIRFTKPEYQSPEELPIKENSFTSNVSFELIEDVLNNSISNGSPLDLESIFFSIGKNAEKELEIKNIFTSENIFISSENNSIAAKKYINSFAFIIIEEYPKIFAIQIENQNDLTDVNEKIIDIYKIVLNKLSVIEVPLALANIHISYLNNLNRIIQYYKIVANEKNDPMLAYFALPKFQENISINEQLFTQIINYIKNSGIIFEEGEPAYEIFNASN
jgi:hypothetical protein